MSAEIVIKNLRVRTTYALPDVKSIMKEICFAKTGDAEPNKLVDGKFVAKHPKETDKALQDAEWRLHVSHSVELEFDIDVEGQIRNLRVVK